VNGPTLFTLGYLQKRRHYIEPPRFISRSTRYPGATRLNIDSRSDQINRIRHQAQSWPLSSSRSTAPGFYLVEHDIQVTPDLVQEPRFPVPHFQRFEDVQLRNRLVFHKQSCCKVESFWRKGGKQWAEVRENDLGEDGTCVGRKVGADEQVVEDIGL
jgi:hypothetical protein